MKVKNKKKKEIQIDFKRASELLLLTASDKREDTIENYIIGVIHRESNCESSLDILSYAKKEFNIELNEQEVDAGLKSLKNKKKITFQNKKWELETTAKNELLNIISEEEKKSLIRLQDFKSNLKLVYDSEDFTDKEVSQLYDYYNSYIIECVFIYGKLATVTFNGNYEGESKVEDTNSAYSTIARKISNAKLKRAFNAIMDNIPDSLTSREVTYIDELSNRAENFFSLGLSKEMADNLFSVEPIKWTIFLDTNVLYSALRIREHPENSAVIKLLELFNNPNLHFDIQLRYLPETFDELKTAKTELENRIKPNKLSFNQMRAALGSKQVDEFTKAFYRNAIEFGDAVQHPSKIILNAVNILKSKKIEIYRNSRKIDTNEESYLDVISAYNTYHKIKNEARKERKFALKEKLLNLIEHDVFLRETIENLRGKQSSQITHFQDCKFFAITLDKALIHFDRYYSLRKNRNINHYIPKFFLPSILLKRLYRFMPVESDDYKTAFVASITQPVFVTSDNKQSSIKTQNALAKFYAMGIDDPKFIFKMITNDVFLNKLDTLSDEKEIEEFVEGELSKELKRTNIALKTTSKNLSATKASLTEKNEQYDSSLTVVNNLQERVSLMEEDREILAKELKKVREKTVSQNADLTPPNQIPIPFDQQAADKKIQKAVKLAKELNQEKRKKFVQDAYLKWKWRPVFLLIILIVPTLLLGIWGLSRFNWDTDVAYNHFLKEYLNHPSWKAIGYISLAILGIIDLFVIKEIHRRWLDLTQIDKFKEKVEIPKELSDSFISDQLED